jgi:hypothetical protein
MYSALAMMQPARVDGRLVPGPRGSGAGGGEVTFPFVIMGHSVPQACAQPTFPQLRSQADALIELASFLILKNYTSDPLNSIGRTGRISNQCLATLLVLHGAPG